MELGLTALSALVTGASRGIGLAVAQGLAREGCHGPELAEDPPFGRLATPDEVADSVVYLASKRASYISGAILTVDGGRAVRHAT